jgi:hypothetical protein
MTIKNNKTQSQKDNATSSKEQLIKKVEHCLSYASDYLENLSFELSENNRCFTIIQNNLFSGFPKTILKSLIELKFSYKIVGIYFENNQLEILFCNEDFK